MADLQYFMVDPKTTNLIGPFVAHDNGNGTYSLSDTAGAGLDSTDRLRVSLYGKNAAAGDTAAQYSPGGRAFVAVGTSQAAADAMGNTVTGWRTEGDSNNYAAIVDSASFNGSTWDRLRTPNVFKAISLSAATAEATIWTPTAGKKFRLMGFLLTCGAASTLTFKDGTGGTTIFAARGTTDQPISPNGMGNGILSAAANNVLTVTRGTSATLDGVVWGTEE